MSRVWEALWVALALAALVYIGIERRQHARELDAFETRIEEYGEALAITRQDRDIYRALARHGSRLEIVGTDLRTGEEQTVALQPGVLLYGIDPECRSCEFWLPFVNELRACGADVVGISIRDASTAWERFLALDFEFPIWKDVGGPLWEITALGTTTVVYFTDELPVRWKAIHEHEDEIHATVCAPSAEEPVDRRLSSVVQ